MSVEEAAEATLGAQELSRRAEDEPIELRQALRAGIGEDPVAGRDAAVSSIARMLFSAWQGELSPRGLDVEKFEAIVSGASHEVWLWLMGDRPYEQLVVALAGRAIRRSADPSPGT